MVLWAGGLYGLNSLCRSALAQAAGAVVGACRVARAPRFDRPVVGMTSLVWRARVSPEAVDPRINDLLARKPVRLATVAMANRTARIIWAVMTRSETYRRPAALALAA